MARVDIPDDWLPIPACIYELPDSLRQNIHDLETLVDPAGIVRENWLVRDQIAQRGALVDSLRDDKATLLVPLQPLVSSEAGSNGLGDDADQCYCEFCQASHLAWTKDPAHAGVRDDALS